MGSRITQLKPVQGFCAETGGAMTLFLATALGVPVSTTHTITGAIVGVGAARRAAAVRWVVAQRIVIAWVLTLPAAALDRRLCLLGRASALTRRGLGRAGRRPGADEQAQHRGEQREPDVQPVHRIEARCAAPRHGRAAAR